MLARADAVAALAAEPFDVLAIGGGITGAGVALDAVTRGYSVALVERGDYAIGTSSRSSKLVHGGLRYLQNFDLGLVREALLERQLNRDRPRRVAAALGWGSRPWRRSGPRRRPRAWYRRPQVRTVPAAADHRVASAGAGDHRRPHVLPDTGTRGVLTAP